MLQSRRDNNLAARFPEVMTSAAALGDVVLDGEIVALLGGRLHFGSLTSAPAARAAAGVGIYYIAFDLIADRDDDLRGLSFEARRARLEELLVGAAPPLELAPSVRDRDEAMKWMAPEQANVGIEGLIVKEVRRPYRPGRTGDWLKIRSVGVIAPWGGVVTAHAGTRRPVPCATGVVDSRSSQGVGDW